MQMIIVLLLFLCLIVIVFGLRLSKLKYQQTACQLKCQTSVKICICVVCVFCLCEKSAIFIRETNSCIQMLPLFQMPHRHAIRRMSRLRCKASVVLAHQKINIANYVQHNSWKTCVTI